MRYSLKKVIPVLIFLLILSVSSITSYGQETSGNVIPQGVYIKLDRDFYEALKNSDKTYSNDPSYQYLKEISISSKFVVKTNLQIIKQQEEIIRLLKSIADKKNK